MNSTPHQGIPFVDLHAQYLSIREEIDAAIASVIERSSFIRGPEVEQFEANFATAIGTKHCVSCGNGTDAIFIALKALNILPGDEVITTAHSWISTSETITLAGGQVVFCDTDESYCIDPDLIEEKITPRTTGIIAVHLYGQPAAMDRISEIARKHNLWVIEDCAQAHLAKHRGQNVGTFGNIATFSFYPGKNLGAMGDAGAIVTSDDRIANWCALYARHGGKGKHEIEGINSRMDGLQAAILDVKLKYLPAWTRQRQRVAAEYCRNLAGMSEIVLPRTFAEREHVYHLMVIRSAARDALMRHLAACGVGTAINYPVALPFLPAYRHLQHRPADFPVAHRNQREILSLPIYAEMTAEMIATVCDRAGQFYAQHTAAAA